MLLNNMGEITIENLNWGDWGTYYFEKFMKDFSSSPEFMNTSFEGYYSHNNAVDDIIYGRESKGDSLSPGICFALYEFATRTVPHRMEDIKGYSVVYNPQRDNRTGAQPSVPKQAPDIFKWVLEGDENFNYSIS